MKLILDNYKKIIFPILLSLIVISFLILPIIASAQGLKNINQAIDTTAQGAGIKGETSLIQIFALLVKVLLGILGFVFVVLIIYGGVEWMMAMGANEKVAKAKKIIINSVIGLVIIILSYSIASFVITALNSTAK
jgi:hypothetical protein